MAIEPEKLRRGAVVLVRFPGDRARPAVVLRSDTLARLPYATVVPFTTTPHAAPDLRVPVAPTTLNGLQQASFAMIDWPQTIRAEHMGEIIGRLDAATLDAIAGRVAVILGIGDSRTGSR
jgi:mRNA interferase MazF